MRIDVHLSEDGESPDSLAAVRREIAGEYIRSGAERVTARMIDRDDPETQFCLVGPPVFWCKRYKLLPDLSNLVAIEIYRIPIFTGREGDAADHRKYSKVEVDFLSRQGNSIQ